MSQFYFIIVSTAWAQIGFNMPVGIKPTQGIEAYTSNSFLVQRKFVFTDEDPTSYVVNLNCTYLSAIRKDAGIMKDPEGDANYGPGNAGSPGNYCAREIAGTPNSTGPFVQGFEITFEELDTEAGGDSIIFYNTFFSISVSGKTLPPKFYLPGSNFFCFFSRDGDSNVGKGFRFRWRAIYYPPANPSNKLIVAGSAFEFDAVTYSLRAGWLAPESTKGRGSTALGMENKAGGDLALAIGHANRASKNQAIAIGYNNLSDGDLALAIGDFNRSLATNSIALGKNNAATADGSIAIGTDNTASGILSMALGSKVSTNGQRGAFIIGDSNPANDGLGQNNLPDQFTARFTNGYRLLTSGNTNPLGVQLEAGGTSWSILSDSTRKERHKAIDGTELLRKISSMHLTTWNYKGQPSIRHYGPMAQDFHKAFGHDGLGRIGSDTLISTQDIEGVTFSAVQALVNENEQLKAEVSSLKVEQIRIKDRLDKLESILIQKTVQASVKED